MRFHKILNIFLYFIVSLAGIIILIFIFINLSISQSFITSSVNRILLKSKVPVHIGSVEKILPYAIHVREVFIPDVQGDTTIYVKDFKAKYKLFALMKRKVILSSVLLDNAQISFLRAKDNAKLNIAETFTNGKIIDPNKPKKNKSQWEFSIADADMSIISFKMFDSLTGIYTLDNIRELRLKEYYLSLLEKTIHAQKLEIEGASGYLILNRIIENEKSDSVSGWNLGFNELSLNNIQYTYSDGKKKQSIDIALGRAQVSSNIMDLNNKEVDLNNISFFNSNISFYNDNQSNKNKIPENDKSSFFPWKFKTKNIEFDNISFKQGPYNSDGIYSDSAKFSISGIQSIISGIQFDKDTASFEIKKLNFELSNGFSMKAMLCKLDSRAGNTTIKLDVETANSTINIDGYSDENFFELIWNNGESQMANISIGNTFVSLKDLFCFLPELQLKPNMDLIGSKPLIINGIIDKNNKGVNFSEVSLSQANNFKIILNGEINNDFSSDSISGNLSYKISDIDANWLKEFLAGYQLEKRIPDFKKIKSKGIVSGSNKSPHINIDLTSDIGNFNFKGAVNLKQKAYSLKASIDKMNVGKFLNQSKFGSYSGSVIIEGSGFDQKTVNAKISVLVDTFQFNHYNYTKTSIDGVIRPSEYELSVLANDPFLSCNLRAFIGTSDSGISVKVKSDFMASLNDLHLYSDTLTVNGSISGTYNKDLNSISSDFLLTDLKLETPQINTQINKIGATFRSDMNDTRFSGEADFFKSEILIKKPYNDLGSLIPVYSNYLKSFLDTSGIGSGIRVSHLPDIKSEMNISYNKIFEIFVPDTTFHFSNINVKLSNDTSENKLDYAIRGTGLEYGKVKLGKFNTGIVDSVGILKLKVDLDSSAISSRPINKFSLTSNFANRKGITRLNVHGSLNDTIYYFEIGSAIVQNAIVCVIPSKQIIMNGVIWQMDSPDFFSFNLTDKKLMPALKMHTDSSFLHLMSEIEEGAPGYKFEFNNVTFGSLISDGMVPGKPKGSIFGSIDFKAKNSYNKKLNIDLNLKNGSWSDINFDNFILAGSYSSDTLKSYKIDMIAELDSSKINLRGVKPLVGNRSLNADFINLPLKTIQPFAKKYVSEMDGKISGNFVVSSSGKTENINGNINFKNASLRIKSLNSTYKLPDASIIFKDKKIVFDQFRVLDSLDNELFVDGFLDYSNPKVLTSNLDVTSSKLQVLNTSEKDNSSFYGDVFIDSKISLKGPLINPVLKGNIRLSGGTEIYYRHTENLNLSESEKVLTFINKNSPEKQKIMPLKTGKGKYNNLSIETIVEIDPKTKINFNLTNKLYKIDLSITGGGLLNYTMLSNNLLNLSGKYEISKGTANLKMIGWPNKSFQITEGGFVRWNDKIDDPELKFEAQSKVRSSYTNPVDGKERNVDFFVTLKLSNRLSEMNVLFTIVTPDQYLMSIINTMSPEEQMRQAITILLFEKIDLPGITTSTNYMSEQVNSLLENQMNQLTKTSIKDIDISFGIDTYKTATQSGAEETKTSLSYEVKKDVLDNRGQIEVSGRLNDASNQKSTNLSLNNVSFEYKLDSAATKFLKVYNEHSYEDIFEGEIVKTGIGITYRKRYKSFSDIWKREKNRNKKQDK